MSGSPTELADAWLPPLRGPHVVVITDCCQAREPASKWASILVQRQEQQLQLPSPAGALRGGERSAWPAGCKCTITLSHWLSSQMTHKTSALPASVIQGTPPEAQIELLIVPLAKSCQHLVWNVEQSHQEMYPKHQIKVNNVLLICPLQSKHCWIICLLQNMLNVESVFLSEKYIHLFCPQEVQRGKLQRLKSPVSGGEPHLINAAMTVWTYASQALLRCLSYWLTFSLSHLHTKIDIFKNTFTIVNLKQNFSLPVSKKHLEMINLSTLPKCPQGEINL